jgi:hypothetical protein
MIPINELIPDTLQQSRRRRSVLNSKEFQHNQQIGLFRSYSTKSVNTMNEIDDLKISFDDKYIIFDFDPTVGDDDLEIYTNFCGNGLEYDMLVNILPFLN